MSRTDHGSSETTYPLGAVVRLTGLSPELLRAWERRHGVVAPVRTAGGTRRYRAQDLDRLRLLKAAVAAGHRIGSLRGRSDGELRALCEAPAAGDDARLAAILHAVGSLDAAEAQRLLSLQLSALGAPRFAREIALPLVREIGKRWSKDGFAIASEHLASAALRSLLGAALQPGAAALRGACVVFGGLPGERHELGLLMAAVTALGAGAHPVYLGPDLPLEDLLDAAHRTRSAALAVGIVMTPAEQATRSVAALRAGLPASVRLWVGGAGSADLAMPPGVERIDDLEQLEERVARLGFERVPER